MLKHFIRPRQIDVMFLASGKSKFRHFGKKKINACGHELQSRIYVHRTLSHHACILADKATTFAWFTDSEMGIERGQNKLTCRISHLESLSDYTKTI